MNGGIATQLLNVSHPLETKIENFCLAPLICRRSSVVRRSSILVQDAEAAPSFTIIPKNYQKQAIQIHHPQLSTQNGLQEFYSVLETFSNQANDKTTPTTIIKNNNRFVKNRSTSILNFDDDESVKRRATIGAFNEMPILKNKKSKVLNKLNFYKKLTKNNTKKEILSKQPNDINKCKKLLLFDDKTKLSINDIIEDTTEENYGGVYIGPESKQENKKIKLNDKASIDSFTSISSSSLKDENQNSVNKNFDTQSTLSDIKSQNKTKQLSSILKKTKLLEQNADITETNLLWDSSKHTQVSNINHCDNKSDKNNCCINKIDDRKISDTLIHLIFKEISSDSLVTFL